MSTLVKLSCLCLKTHAQYGFHRALNTPFVELEAWSTCRDLLTSSYYTWTKPNRASPFFFWETEQGIFFSGVKGFCLEELRLALGLTI